MNKFLVVGSAPYMNDWAPKHLEWFIKNDYKIICFNNSWKLIPLSDLYLWFHSSDFESANTFIPTNKEIPGTNRVDSYDRGNRKFPKPKENIPCLDKLYGNKKCGTMFLNLIYSILRAYGDKCEVVVIGCDMIYTKSGDTFYSHEKISKARNDPLLLWGEEGLTKECNQSYNQFKKYGGTILNASTNATRLPYPKFTAHL